MGITVYVDDNFHYMDEDERYEHGTFETKEEALSACRRIVDGFLLNVFKPGMSAEELYEQYTGFGEDPWFRGSSPGYSSWEYAKKRCAEIAANGTEDEPRK